MMTRAQLPACGLPVESLFARPARLRHPERLLEWRRGRGVTRDPLVDRGRVWAQLDDAVVCDPVEVGGDVSVGRHSDEDGRGPRRSDRHPQIAVEQAQQPAGGVAVGDHRDVLGGDGGGAGGEAAGCRW